MKKLICLVLAVMLALSAVSAFAAEYTDKDTVKKVQQALNDAGYNCGTPDGAAGKKTKAAITDYQNANGLSATGVIDDELLVALGLAKAETAEEAPAEAEVEEIAIPDDIEFWTKDEKKFVIFQPNAGTMLFCIDWVGEIQTLSYSVDDNGYKIDGGLMDIAIDGDNLNVDFWEYGTSRTYHKGTLDEYNAIKDLIANPEDVSWLYGEWSVKNSSGEMTGDKIAISEDGTCTYADTKYTWKTGGEYFGITVEQNGRTAFSIYEESSSKNIRMVNPNNGEFFYLVK